jgi:phosphoribosylaminoimidazole-succinocarboxamide synthase
VPKKGEILLAITLFWEDLLPHYTHTIAFGRKIYDFLPKGGNYPHDLHLQAIVVQEVKMFPYEFIFRGRMAGSLWSEYYNKGLPNPYGLQLPQDMQLMDDFPQPIFTPTEKSATDDPLAEKDLVGVQRGDIKMLRDIYQRMRKHALSRGIDIIDTKLEVGLHDGRRTLADEWGTPDSSRFVDVESIKRGEEPLWFDKQFLREEAVAAWKQNGGNKCPLHFSPAALTEATSRYHTILERLAGESLSQLQQDLGIS